MNELIEKNSSNVIVEKDSTDSDLSTNGKSGLPENIDDSKLPESLIELPDPYKVPIVYRNPRNKYDVTYDTDYPSYVAKNYKLFHPKDVKTREGSFTDIEMYCKSKSFSGAYSNTYTIKEEYTKCGCLSEYEILLKNEGRPILEKQILTLLNTIAITQKDNTQSDLPVVSDENIPRGLLTVLEYDIVFLGQELFKRHLISKGKFLKSKKNHILIEDALDGMEAFGLSGLRNNSILLNVERNSKAVTFGGANSVDMSFTVNYGFYVKLESLTCARYYEQCGVNISSPEEVKAIEHESKELQTTT